MDVPIQPTNSQNIIPAIAPFSHFMNEPYANSADSAISPPGLKKWYSNDVFKTVTFFVLIVSILGISTACFLMDKLSSDQFLGVVSSLLFLSTPSPLQRKPKKKVVYQSINNSVPV